MEKPSQNAISYQFGEFRLDTAQRVIFRAGRPVALAPKVLETLLALVERSGTLVTKDELMTLLWPDTFVEESNLTQNVFLLRKVLGEAENGMHYIETVPRRGYRFMGKVEMLVQEEGIEWILANRSRTRIVHEEETTDGESGNQPTTSSGGDTAHASMRRAANVPLPQGRAGTRLFLPRRALWLGSIVALGLLLLVGGFALNRFLRQSRGQAIRASLAAPAIELKRLTYDSKAFGPAVSPSGEYVAYTFHEPDHDSIKLKNIANGSTVQIMPPSAQGYGNLAFSPDGNYLYFTTSRPGLKNAVIARVPVFGGTPQYLIEEVWSGFSLSPDGRQIAFFRGYSVHDVRLLIANLDGSGERELIRSKAAELWFAIWSAGPSWSPDGQRIVTMAGGRGAAGNYAYLLEVDVGNGVSKELPGVHWYQGAQVAWLPDGTGLVAVAQDKIAAPYQVWLVAYPSGSMRRLTNDLLDYDKLSLSADGRLLVVQQETITNHIWVVPDGDETRARQLTFGASAREGTSGLAWTPDGHILFTSARSGAIDIWIMNADGTAARQLTADTGGANWRPRATPDGRHIVFTSNRGGRQNIWRMDVDGSNPIRLTSGEGEGTPYVSPDGRWLYYTNHAVTPAAIERIALDGGPAFRLPSQYDASEPVLSPDGKLIAYEHYDDRRGWHTALLPAEGGAAVKVFDFHAFRAGVRWTNDGQALLYTDAHRPDNVWRQPLGGGSPQQVTHFKEDGIAYFDLSPDGKQFAIARGNAYSDVVLITNFR
jgi:Tol biopolymer transport system component/DNA-binding winged helix-turn-helix (wHTH) protein